MLDKVTFTGIDNKTDFKDLVSLKKDYPFVEYGMLVSERNTNKDTDNRYPSLMILDRFETGLLDLSLHICGKLARDVIKYGNWGHVYDMMGSYMEFFQRIQLNVAGMNKISKELMFPVDKDILIQFTSEQPYLYELYKDPPHVCGFQDASGGKGIVGTEWMKTDDSYFGYAGGIHSENVLEILKEIESINKNMFWIDMESSVRTEEIFDITKCRKICELIDSYKKEA